MRLQKYINDSLLLELSIGKAAVFADKHHFGQHRKSSGEPYIKHPIGTYKILKEIGVKDIEVFIAAILHDTIEDTDVSYNIIKKEFNKSVADLVQAVTSNKKEIKVIGKPEYLLKKMINISDNELLIKLADRLHNLEDINSVSSDFATKMIQQTTFILQGLRDKRSLTNQHKKLIRKINKQIQSYIK